MDGSASRQRARGIRKQLEPDIEHGGVLPRERRVHEDVATANLLAVDAGQSERRPVPGQGALAARAVYLDRAHSDRPTRRQDAEVVPEPRRSRPDAPRHDGASPRKGKGTVNRHSEGGRFVPWPQGGRLGVHRVQERSKPRSGTRRHGKRSNERNGGVPQPVAHLPLYQREPVGVHQVALGEHGDAARDAERFHDGEMLAGLRLDALVRGDDQQHEVHAGRARHHGAHEILMAGNVHHAGNPPVRQPERGEVQVNRDAPGALLGQPIDPPASERLDEC